MNVVFRVDSSVEIGIGHLMRCLALAERLQKEKNAKITFISRNLKGNLINIVQQKGFMAYHLPFAQFDGLGEGYAHGLAVPQEVDAQETMECIRMMGIKPEWLIVDNYAIDVIWEKRIRPFVKKIFVIDDLANRSHDCDALLDQNSDIQLKNYYDGLIPSYCRLFGGPSYVLFREEFLQIKNVGLVKDRTHIPRVALVAFGGSDPTNETEKVLLALSNIKYPDIIIHVVVGSSNPYKESIYNLCGQDIRFKYHCQIDYMAKLLQTVDFVIGAPGTSLWEWCFLQVPSLVISVADNQRQCADYRADSDLCVFLGETEEITQKILEEIFIQVFSGKITLNRVKKAYERYFPHGSRMGDIIEFLSEGARDNGLGTGN